MQSRAAVRGMAPVAGRGVREAGPGAGPKFPGALPTFEVRRHLQRVKR
jgi:hypothetical protein